MPDAAAHRAGLIIPNVTCKNQQNTSALPILKQQTKLWTMLRILLWVLIGAMTGWLVWRRVRKGSVMTAIGLVLGLAAAVYVGLAVMLFVFQPRLLYMPFRAVEVSPADINLAFEDVRIAAPDGQTLAAWYIPAKNATHTVLFCHGNAGNISHRLDTLALFHNLGLNCLIFDYRGYGQSTGKPTEEGTIVDALAGRQWLLDNKQILPENIIFFGRSLGGAVAALAAARVADAPPAGLVVESSFTSVPDMGAHLYPWLPVRWFARFAYDAKAAIDAVNCPVAIIHSPDDELVPFAMGQRLYEAAVEPKRFFELAGTHNEGFVENMPLYRTIWQDTLDWITHSELQKKEISNP